MFWSFDDVTYHSLRKRHRMNLAQTILQITTAIYMCIYQIKQINKLKKQQQKISFFLKSILITQKRYKKTNYNTPPSELS